MFLANSQGILISVYYGAYSDRHGRKVVCLMTFSGYVLALLWILGVCEFHISCNCGSADIGDPRGYLELPIKLVWASSLFYFIGGGNQVLWYMLFSLISDTVYPTFKFVSRSF